MRYMRAHHSSFLYDEGLNVTLEDLILVTGYTKTTSWTIMAFTTSESYDGSDSTVRWNQQPPEIQMLCTMSLSSVSLHGSHAADIAWDWRQGPSPLLSPPDSTEVRYIVTFIEMS